MLETAFAGLFGLLIGSFLNVCIHRWPRDLSVVAPRSACPACNAPIAARDNIPLLSFLLLSGRCRHCRASISWRYPVIELTTGLLFAGLVAQRGLTLPAARDAALCAILIALIVTDWETRLLPEPLTIGGIALGLCFAALTPLPDGLTGILFGWRGRLASVADSAIGALVPALTLWTMGWLFEKIRAKQGLGFGDVMMLAAIGAFAGLQAALLTLVVGSTLGSIVGLIWIRAKGEDAATFELPMGSFLGAAGIFVALLGPRVIRWYSSML